MGKIPTYILINKSRFLTRRQPSKTMELTLIPHDMTNFEEGLKSDMWCTIFVFKYRVVYCNSYVYSYTPQKTIELELIFRF